MTKTEHAEAVARCKTDIQHLKWDTMYRDLSKHAQTQFPAALDMLGRAMERLCREYYCHKAKCPCLTCQIVREWDGKVDNDHH